MKNERNNTAVMATRAGRFLTLMLFVLSASVGAGGDDVASVAIAREYLVAPRDVSFTIRQRGILESAEAEPCIVMTHGYIQEIVEQGTPVKKGDVIFRMDDTFARESLEQRRDNIEKEELSLEILRARLAFTTFEEEQNLALRDTELEHARLEESEELSHPTERERRLLQIERELAVLDMQDAEDACTRDRRLFDKGFISESALKPSIRKLEIAQAFLEELDLKIELAEKGADEERRIELRRAVERAEAQKQRARLRMDRRLAEIRNEIEASEKRILENRHHLSRHQEEIDNAVVRGTRDGVVKVRSYRDWRAGGRQREYKAGVEKYPQDIVADVIDPGKMKVKLVVNEADFHYLEAGMPVRVTMPAFPGQSFAGKLEQLGAIGHDRNQVDPTARSEDASEIMMFSAEISFDGGGTCFRPGMSAMVEVIVTALPDSVVVPREAVVRSADGAFAVYCKQPEGPVLTSLQGRILNERYFLVESGLAAGDVILVNGKGDE